MSSPRPNEADTVNSGALATIIALVAFATLAIALVVTKLVRDEVDAVSSERVGSQENAYRALKSDQLAELGSTPSWLDRAKGLVSLPIERAMDLTLEAVRRNPRALSPGAPEPEEEIGAGGAGPDSEGTEADAAVEGEAADGAPSGDAAESAPPTGAPGAPASGDALPKVAPSTGGAPAPVSPKAPAPSAPAPSSAPAATPAPVAPATGN